ncbi:MAG: glycosyltransferase family 4 protein [Deltaproteobacteria bacterium]|nr:glycosyltransferase family 4 protein [Deltaproteobacteria bacterium]
MTRILHIICCLADGGAARAMIAVTKYLSQFGDFQHRVISLLPVAPEALRLGENSGMTVIVPRLKDEISHEIEHADIVHVSWWNSPEIYEVLRSDLPAMRLLIWFHVAGDMAPQIITKELVDFSDFAVGCSPYTYQCPVIQALPGEVRLHKTGMVYGAADFDRLRDFQPKVHESYNVGYVGVATEYKMHPNYVSMSASIDVENVRFIICGATGERLREEIASLGDSERFELRNHVADIKEVFEKLDVFGYPLGVHVAAECSVQEAMFAGIPPVVFPAGGLENLVINDYTGLVVHSEAEYKHAIEYLYYNPEERKRLGRNAREYAKQIFGGENAARKLASIYKRMLDLPKKVRFWGGENPMNVYDEAISLDDITDRRPDYTGAERFIESLGSAAEAEWFRISMCSQDVEELFRVEKKIAGCRPFLYWGGTAGGIHHYGRYYQNDGYLRLWSGLVWQRLGQYSAALSEFMAAHKAGCDHWRVLWYAAQAAESDGKTPVAEEAVSKVLLAAPQFIKAHEMKERVEKCRVVGEDKRYSTMCPHCDEMLFVDRSGLWECPGCGNDFIV